MSQLQKSNSLTPSIAVVDVGSGNLFSLVAAIRRLGWQAERVTRSEQLSAQCFDALVLPGQGRFGPFMSALDRAGFTDPLRAWQKPLLGICVGMQALFEASEEDEGAVGLCLLEGKVERLNAPKSPMIGWAKITASGADPLRKMIPDGFAYFVNRYVVKNSEYATTTTRYGEAFCASVQRANICGVQFHPEKSGVFGLEVLKQCLV